MEPFDFGMSNGGGRTYSTLVIARPTAVTEILWWDNKERERFMKKAAQLARKEAKKQGIRKRAEVAQFVEAYVLGYTNVRRLEIKLENQISELKCEIQELKEQEKN